MASQHPWTLGSGCTTADNFHSRAARSCEAGGRNERPLSRLLIPFSSDFPYLIASAHSGKNIQQQQLNSWTRRLFLFLKYTPSHILYIYIKWNKRGLVCVLASHSSHMSYSSRWRVKYLSHFPCPQKECSIEYLFKVPLPINSLHSHNNLVKSYYQTYLKLRKLRVKDDWSEVILQRDAEGSKDVFPLVMLSRLKEGPQLAQGLMQDTGGTAPCWHGPRSPLRLLCRRICYSVEKIQV